jgi:CRP-like cAMP-binding protein
MDNTKIEDFCKFSNLEYNSSNFTTSRSVKNEPFSNYSRIIRRVRFKVLACNAFLKIYSEVRSTPSKSSIAWVSGSKSSHYLRFLKRPSTQIIQNAESKWLIKPNNRFKIFWNIIISITLLYTATIMPYSTVFLESNEYDAWFYIEIIMDGLFFIDILINFNSAFYASDGTLVQDRKKVCLKYIKSWLIVDVISCIPFGYIGKVQTGYQSPNSTSSSMLNLLRVPKFYKLFRITRFIKMLKHYNNRDILEKFQDMFGIKLSAMKFITSMLSIVMSVHIVSCFWYFLSKIQGNQPNTWVYELGYQDYDNFSLYIISLYWAITTLTTVGYGDIHAFNNLEKLFSICWMVFSVYFLSFVIGSLTNMLSSIDTKESILTNKLAAIDEFAIETKIDKKVLHKLKHAIRYTNEKSGFSWTYKKDIFDELPRDLRYEISIAMYGGAAKNLHFFRDKDPAVVTAIVPFLVPMLIQAEDFVYRRNEYAEEIYFITKGKVSYLYLDDTKPIRPVRQGNYFGDIEIILHKERIYSTKAHSNTELLSMNKQIISNIEREYPSVWKSIRNNSIATEILNKKKFIEIHELKKLSSGKVNFHEYRKNIERKVADYKITLKKNISALNKKNQEISLDFFFNEIKIINTSIVNLREEISNIKNFVVQKSFEKSEVQE